VYFNYLKKDVVEWAKGIPTTTSGTNWQRALEPNAWETTVEDVVKKIETLLGKSLSAADRALVRDYVDMAMQVGKP
jgi:hypothetical protein